MAELTNRVEADLVLDRKMDAGRYGGGDLHNYVASQELTVTITLSEYRELVSGIATKDKDISIANDDKYKREQQIREVKDANDTLKAENYDLNVIIDNLRKQIGELENKLKTNDAANTQQADMISDLRKKLKEAQDTILYIQRNIDVVDVVVLAENVHRSTVVKHGAFCRKSRKRKADVYSRSYEKSCEILLVDHFLV